ncbi:MAG: methylmalonyl-CoA epimerase [Sulfobacillus acidophilus]|uniref:Methylmalonyl-CoA epimerase n=1 Tax=Sulfobacillus acidophilus TaxID=53633 RepID=A0A2T2WFW8_9FIRM|nr:MAG: methylmalonyl-CoA epimerase [Sulfobacillus acidophilus]
MKLDHIGVAVEDLDASLSAYQALGLPSSHRETVPDDQVEVAFVPFSGGRFELLQPHGVDTPVGRFLAKRGPGMHHVALAVDDIRMELQRLRDAGVRLIDAEPRRGAEGTWVAFVHPAATGGVLLELVERAAESDARG